MARMFLMYQLRRLALVVLWCAIALPAGALELINATGRFADGNAIKLRMLADIPDDAKAILLEVPHYSVAPIKVEANGDAAFTNAEGPMARLGRALKADGIGYALLDIPSNLTAPAPATWWSNPDHHRDITTALKALRAKYPKTKVFLSGYLLAARSVVAYASKEADQIDGVVLLSPYVDTLRNVRMRGKVNGLVIQAPTARCYAISMPSTQELISSTGWQLLAVYYDKWGNRNACAADSQAGLTQRVKEVADQLAAWVGGKALPAALGDAKAGPALHEEVRMLQGSAGKVEVTLYRPVSPGPHPLLIWNHGDVEVGSPYLSGTRYREPLLANELVDMGLAVAVVARPGVGNSEGNYRSSFSSADGDPTYKGRIHAKELLAVWPELQKLPWVDKSRLLLGGQSAGGYAVVTALAMHIPELIGVINYSGGRTDMNSGSAASHNNKMMVSGFAEIGQTAKVPLLMVFAENDSRYTANTIRESHKAFTGAGGKATLALYPPQANDGHFVHQQPSVWREDVRKYLQGLSITAK
jgi:dienelactone hydrolase